MKSKDWSTSDVCVCWSFSGSERFLLKTYSMKGSYRAFFVYQMNGEIVFFVFYVFHSYWSRNLAIRILSYFIIESFIYELFIFIHISDSFPMNCFFILQNNVIQSWFLFRHIRSEISSFLCTQFFLKEADISFRIVLVLLIHIKITYLKIYFYR